MDNEHLLGQAVVGPKPKTTLPDHLIVAPIWALIYVGQMAVMCHYKRPLRVMMAADAWFDEIGADGCFLSSANGTDDLIIIRENAENNGQSLDVLAHEFAHALHSEIDRSVATHWLEFRDPGHLPEAEAAYRRAVEDFIPLLGGMIQMALPPLVEFPALPAETNYAG